jgi:branched-chain amino acid transport system permease protein
MIDFLQLVFSGFATGSIYALAALAFMLTALLSTVVLGWAFKRAIVDPLFKYGMMQIVVASIGLSIVMKNAMRTGYSAEAHPFPSLFSDKLFNVAGVNISTGDVGTLVCALVVVFGVQAFLAKTITGRAMQAVAQNTESATVLACVAAILVTPVYLAKFDMGDSLGTKAFFAAIIGGFNNSRGALLGGLIVGVSENLAAAYISPSYKDAVALVVFMIVILFRPQGLLGKKEERKV